jgi:hypothetical protein
MIELGDEGYQRLCERLADGTELSLFCGAGISVRAGVPSGQTIIDRLEDDYADEPWPDDIEYDEAWNRALPGEKHREQRRSLIEQWFTGIPPVNNQYPDAFGRRAYPGNHYLIASLVDHGVFDDVVTTNFDHLLEIAFMLLPEDRFRLYQYDDQIDSKQLDDTLSKLFKLHGDFLYDDLANLSEEMKTRVDESLQAKLTTYLQQRGLVVLGYNGHDDSIMSLLEAAARSEEGLTGGLWWVSYSQIDLDAETNARIRSLKETMEHNGKEFHLITPPEDETIPARDFLLNLHSTTGASMPIIDPFGLNTTDHFVVSLIDNDTHFPRQNLPAVTASPTDTQAIDDLQTTITEALLESDTVYLRKGDQPHLSQRIGSAVREIRNEEQIFYYNCRHGRGYLFDDFRNRLFSFANTIGIVDRDTNTIRSVGHQVLDAGATIVVDGVDLDINHSAAGKRLMSNLASLISINTISPNGTLLIISTQEPSEKFRNLIRSRVGTIRGILDEGKATHSELQAAAAEADLDTTAAKQKTTQNHDTDLPAQVLTTVDCRPDESIEPAEIESWLQTASPEVTEVAELVAGLRRAEDLSTLVSMADDVDVEPHVQTLQQKGFIETIGGRFFLLPTPRSVIISQTTDARRRGLFRAIAEGYLESGASVPQYASSHNLIEAERAYNFAEEYQSGLMILQQMGNSLSRSGYQQFRFELMDTYVDHLASTNPEWFHTNLPPVQRVKFLHTAHKCENEVDEIDLEYMQALNELETRVLAEVAKPIAEFYFARQETLNGEFEAAETHLQTVLQDVGSDPDPHFLGKVHDLMVTIKEHRRQVAFEETEMSDLREDIIHHGEEAAKYYEQSGNKFDVARIQDNIGSMHNEQMRPDEAEPHLDAARDVFSQVTGFSKDKAIHYRNTMDFHLNTFRTGTDDPFGELQAAEGYFFEAVLNYAAKTDFQGIAKILIQFVGDQLAADPEHVFPDTEDTIQAIFDMADRRAADITDILQRLSIFVEMHLQESEDRSLLEFWLPYHAHHIKAIQRERSLPRAVAVRVRFLKAVTEAFNSQYVDDEVYPKLQQTLVSNTVLDCALAVMAEDMTLPEAQTKYNLSDDQTALLQAAFDELTDIDTSINQ